VVAYRRDKTPIYCRDIKADGAMTVLLKDAMQPNLVQTLENNPAFVHGGPFANIAHGCNSVVATTTALKLADYVVTEAGFGADLGAEKFFDIKCRKAGLKPDAAVIVATVRAMKMNGGVKKDDLGAENVERWRRAAPISAATSEREKVRRAGGGGDQPFRHRHRCRSPGGQGLCCQLGAEAILCKHWAKGSAGIEELAHKVVELAEAGRRSSRRSIPTRCPVREDRDNRQAIYHADEVIADKIRARAAGNGKQGYGKLPVCMAKTQYSFSTDPNLRGAPTGHTVPVREVRLSAGAGFIVVICGEIMTMPGLPRAPSSEKICLNDNGQIEGLF
jgi:formate--tetrahydrofolate ligase